MSLNKRIRTLEAFIDAVRDSREVVVHNPVEYNLLIDREIDLQEKYKKITGEYYLGALFSSSKDLKR